MLNFFKSFSSNIHYNYSVQSRPTFTAGCWAVFDAKSKSTNDPVSVFVLDKKTASEALSSNGIKPRSVTLAEIWDFAKRGVEQLTKLRHPAVLRLVEPLESSKSSLTFVTERVTGTLALAATDLDELAIVRGLTTVVQALSFLHESLGIVHLNLTPQTVFMDAQGDWKLAGLEFVVHFDEYSSSDYFLSQLDPRMPQYMQPAYDFLAPELVLNRKVRAANDVWSLACVIYTLFIRKQPMRTRGNPSAYKDELKQFSKQVAASATVSKFPASLQPYLGALFCEDPDGRMGLAALETTDFFQNPLIKALKSLDEFAAKPVDEKVAFLKHFEQLLPQFPKQMRIRKILKFATTELSGPRDPATALLVGNVLFAVCADMSRLTFQEQVLPLFPKLQDYFQFQESVANNLEVVANDTSDKDFSKYVLPLLTDILKHHEAQYAPVQTLVLSSASVYKDNLTVPKMEQTMFPAVIDCFAATPARSVKVAATQCLSVLVDKGVSKALIADSMIPALERMKTRDPAVSIAVSKLWESVAPKLSTTQVFEQAVPHLLTLSLSKELTVQQFKSITSIAKREIENVEKVKAKELAHNHAPADDADDWLSAPPVAAPPVASAPSKPHNTTVPTITPKPIPGPQGGASDLLGAPVKPVPAPAAANVPKTATTTTPSSYGRFPPPATTTASAARPQPQQQPQPKAAPQQQPSLARLQTTPATPSPPQGLTASVLRPNSMASMQAMNKTNQTAPGVMTPMVPNSTSVLVPTSAGPATAGPLSSFATLQPMVPAGSRSPPPPKDDEFGSFFSSSNNGSLI